MMKKKVMGKGFVVLVVGTAVGFAMQIQSASAGTCRKGMTCPLPSKSCDQDSEEYTQVRQATDFSTTYATGHYTGIATCGQKNVLNIHTSKCDKDDGGAGPAGISDRVCP